MKTKNRAFGIFDTISYKNRDFNLSETENIRITTGIVF